MKTFQLVTLFALIAAAMAFAPNQAPKGEFLRTVCHYLWMKMSLTLATRLTSRQLLEDMFNPL